jgi:hypothetical protein
LDFYFLALDPFGPAEIVQRFLAGFFEVRFFEIFFFDAAEATFFEVRFFEIFFFDAFLFERALPAAAFDAFPADLLFSVFEAFEAAFLPVTFLVAIFVSYASFPILRLLTHNAMGNSRDVRSVLANTSVMPNYPVFQQRFWHPQARWRITHQPVSNKRGRVHFPFTVARRKLYPALFR